MLYVTEQDRTKSKYCDGFIISDTSEVPQKFVSLSQTNLMRALPCVPRGRNWNENEDFSEAWSTGLRQIKILLVSLIIHG